MQKINHAKRVQREAGQRCTDAGEVYYSLCERAAGYDKAQRVLDECQAKLEALGVSEGDACDILVTYGQALQESGFNAGFDLGFGEGALLGTFGHKAG